ncbi:MAG: Glyoxalase/bleomycin resistance protein/dioxygenase [Gemmatimonadetes bacterium]|jgi:methylmalonyl-CoA/ethylmalonyl-CoA epimerase|nr:Glyoxalase/bleomycin resistance protein/dioxygenase [Gemmatimonadota bacterium]
MPALAASAFSLGQAAVTVRDVAASTAFYRDVVGLPFLFAAGPTLAFFAIGTTRLMIGASEGSFQPGSGTVLYLKTDDIIAAHGAMQGRGCAFVDAPHRVAPMPDHDLWMCFFTDPDGHSWGLMAERPKGS